MQAASSHGFSPCRTEQKRNLFSHCEHFLRWKQVGVGYKEAPDAFDRIDHLEDKDEQKEEDCEEDVWHRHLVHLLTQPALRGFRISRSSHHNLVFVIHHSGQRVLCLDCCNHELMSGMKNVKTASVYAHSGARSAPDFSSGSKMRRPQARRKRRIGGHRNTRHQCKIQRARESKSQLHTCQLSGVPAHHCNA